jgi:hypothetical protein
VLTLAKMEYLELVGKEGAMRKRLGNFKLA